MVNVFADNQVMATEGSGSASVISTDPVPMRGNDRFAAIATAHYLFGGTNSNATLSFKLEGSNDGTTWFDFTPVAWGDLSASGTADLEAETAIYAFVRMKFSFLDTNGTGNAFVCFDVHAIVDKA